MDPVPDQSNDSLWKLAIQSYYEKIVNVVYYLSRDRFLAEDIAQETFAKAMEKFHQLKDLNKMLPWLISIAANFTKTQIKHNQRMIAVSDIDLSVHLGLTSNHLSGFDNLEEKEFLENAIFKLSLLERKVILLRYYLDMKEKDIAFAMKISVIIFTFTSNHSSIMLIQSQINGYRQSTTNVDVKQAKVVLSPYNCVK